MRKSAIVLAVISLFSFTARAYSDVTMSLSLDATNYVIREPIRFQIEIANASQDTVRLFPVNELGNHMRHMFFEITRPDGSVEWRKFLTVFYLEAVGIGPRGEPLAPGGRLDLLLYPYMTYWAGPPSAKPQSKKPRFTFDKPGEYRVRVAYCVESVRRYLWKPEGGILYSNSLTLELRNPSVEENAILDAVWSGDRFSMSQGDMATHLEGDAVKLRAVIDRYPDAPFVRYAKLTLGRTLAYSANPATALEGIEILTQLHEEFPKFRVEEAFFHRANALDLHGDSQEALEVYEAALVESPKLVDSYVFMTRKLWAETHQSDVHEIYLRERESGRKIRSLMKEATE